MSLVQRTQFNEDSDCVQTWNPSKSEVPRLALAGPTDHSVIPLAVVSASRPSHSPDTVERVKLRHRLNRFVRPVLIFWSSGRVPWRWWEDGAKADSRALAREAHQARLVTCTVWLTSRFSLPCVVPSPRTLHSLRTASRPGALCMSKSFLVVEHLFFLCLLKISFASIRFYYLQQCLLSDFRCFQRCSCASVLLPRMQLQPPRTAVSLQQL